MQTFIAPGDPCVRMSSTGRRGSCSLFVAIVSPLVMVFLLVDFAEIGDIDATCSMYKEHSGTTVVTYSYLSIVGSMVVRHPKPALRQMVWQQSAPRVKRRLVRPHLPGRVLRD